MKYIYIYFFSYYMGCEFHYLTELFHVGIQVEGVHADGGQPGDTLQHFVGGGPALSAPKHIICSLLFSNKNVLEKG